MVAGRCCAQLFFGQEEIGQRAKDIVFSPSGNFIAARVVPDQSAEKIVVWNLHTKQLVFMLVPRQQQESTVSGIVTFCFTVADDLLVGFLTLALLQVWDVHEGIHKKTLTASGIENSLLYAFSYDQAADTVVACGEALCPHNNSKARTFLIKGVISSGESKATFVDMPPLIRLELYDRGQWGIGCASNNLYIIDGETLAIRQHLLIEQPSDCSSDESIKLIAVGGEKTFLAAMTQTHVYVYRLDVLQERYVLNFKISLPEFLESVGDLTWAQQRPSYPGDVRSHMTMHFSASGEFLLFNLPGDKVALVESMSGMILGALGSVAGYETLAHSIVVDGTLLLFNDPGAKFLYCWQLNNGRQPLNTYLDDSPAS